MTEDQTGACHRDWRNRDHPLQRPAPRRAVALQLCRPGRMRANTRPRLGVTRQLIGPRHGRHRSDLATPPQSWGSLSGNIRGNAPLDDTRNCLLDE